MKLPWIRRQRPARTLAEIEAIYPEAAAAFRAQGKAAETQRVRAVYLAARLRDLDPVTEGAMFDGTTVPGDAAMRQVAVLKAATANAGVVVSAAPTERAAALPSVLIH